MRYTLDGKTKLLWADARDGDIVYIAGDLDEAGEPTMCYGAHVVYDIKKHTLINASGKVFYEYFPYMFHYPATQKLWGTEVIPRKDWIDTSKEYTCNGRPVLGLYIQLTNSCNREVTFPVKGSIKMSKTKTDYCVWTLDGKIQEGETSEYDLKLKE